MMGLITSERRFGTAPVLVSVGCKAVLRIFSKDDRATLEYQPAGGGSRTEWIRYNP
jgi:hypothetical protein